MNYLYYNEKLEYPYSVKAFSPSENYPEYQYGDTNIQKIENTVYKGIREIFHGLGLDKEHFGTRAWNPLGEYIVPGQNVLIKPNFVMHYNRSDNPEDMDSLITHPSVIRCIIDYCLIALQGRGSLVIADAPVKDCDFSLLMKNGGYDQLVGFYKNANVSPMPRFFDLRGPLEEGGQYQQNGQGVLVNLAEKSYFYSCNHNWNKYRIPNYDFRKVIKHHHGLTQEYLINSIVLDADVVISLPKPKTHRKNGYTGALKNFVGVSYSKEYLPHHTAGAIIDGGDEYKSKNEAKDRQSKLRDKIDIYRTSIDALQKRIDITPNRIYRFFLRKIKGEYIRKQAKGWRMWRQLGSEDDKLSSNIGDERAREGSWYGNDTLWRTVLDLNIAVEYADCLGKIHKERQRKIIYIGDMVIAGEKEGPMSPSPKKCQTLIFSDNPVEFDCILVKFMGFDWRKFKGLFEATKSEQLSVRGYDEIEILSNWNKYCGLLNKLSFTTFTPFEPADGWKEHIELGD